MITDWAPYKGLADSSSYFRISGEMVELRIFKRADLDDELLIHGLEAFLPARCKIKYENLMPRAAVGMSAVVGWPSWFPIFFRRRVFQMTVPATCVKK